MQLPAATDNYYIRSLLGERVYQLPPGGVTQAHLFHAEIQLMSVDILIDPSQDWAAHNLETGLGWESKKATQSVIETLSNSSPQMKDMISDNRLDLVLHHFSNLLGSLDAMLFSYVNASGLVVHSPKTCGYVGLLKGPVSDSDQSRAFFSDEVDSSGTDRETDSDGASQDEPDGDGGGEEDGSEGEDGDGDWDGDGDTDIDANEGGKSKAETYREWKGKIVAASKAVQAMIEAEGVPQPACMASLPSTIAATKALERASTLEKWERVKPS
eukprot:gene3232-13255_t